MGLPTRSQSVWHGSKIIQLNIYRSASEKLSLSSWKFQEEGRKNIFTVKLCIFIRVFEEHLEIFRAQKAPQTRKKGNKVSRSEVVCINTLIHQAHRKYLAQLVARPSSQWYICTCTVLTRGFHSASRLFHPFLRVRIESSRGNFFPLWCCFFFGLNIKRTLTQKALPVQHVLKDAKRVGWEPQSIFHHRAYTLRRTQVGMIQGQCGKKAFKIELGS